MNYENAVKLVEKVYTENYKLILLNLSTDAIITLANLQNQNITRTMTNETILKLSSMQPHQQVGYLSNPMLQFMIEQPMIKTTNKIQPKTNNYREYRNNRMD